MLYLLASYADLPRAIDRIAAHWAFLAPESEGIPPERVVAILCATSIDMPLLEIALTKLGLTPLLLSVNNSAAAVAHLCKLTSATHLIYGPRYAGVAAEAATLAGVEILPEVRFPLWGPGGLAEVDIPAFPARLRPQDEGQRTAVILHSSGSTGFPKPVYVTHYGLIANAAVSVPKTGFSALPLFHGFGHFSM